MKKIFFVLALISLLPICFVSCAKSVKEIRIIESRLKHDEKYGDYVVLSLDENGEAEYEIKYEISPESKRRVNFEYDYKSDFVSGDDRGVVKFTGVGSVMVTLSVKNRDRTTLQKTLFVIASDAEFE